MWNNKYMNLRIFLKPWVKGKNYKENKYYIKAYEITIMCVKNGQMLVITHASNKYIWLDWIIKSCLPKTS